MSRGYSDASSSFWAPGWNFERWVHADENDLTTLPESELVKIQDGLLDVLGDGGMGRLSRYMFDLEQKKQQRGDSKKRGLNLEEALQLAAVGFVVFVAACNNGSDDDDDRWASFKAQFQRIVELLFERAIARAKEEGATIPDDFDEARARFTIQWEEAPAGQESTVGIHSSDSLRSQSAALRPELNSRASGVIRGESVKYRRDEQSLAAPGAILIVVAADKDAGLEHGHEESIWLKPVFKVAAEALVESLIDVLDMGTPLQQVTCSVRGANERDRATEHTGQEVPKREADELDDTWWSLHPSPERMRKRR